MKRARRGLGWWWGAALLAAAIAFWPLERSRHEATLQEPAPQPMAATTYLVSAQATVPTTARSRPAAAHEAPAAVSGEEHSHPLTPEREALQHELRLVGALQDALDLEDVPALRALVARYSAHVPGDENKLAEGYTRLADCLDAAKSGNGMDAARAAAAAYYESERASTLRRYVRRVCLER